VKYDEPPGGRMINARVLYVGGREFEYQKPAKSYTALQSCVALALWRRDGHRKLVTRFGV